MEAKTILLTFLVFALWTSTTTAQCLDMPDGDYCEHCWQPIKCTVGVSTDYPPCSMGQACTVAAGVAYCTPHAETACACAGAGDQCDAYNPTYIEHCSAASGPILVEQCSSSATICFDGECRIAPTCNAGLWSLLKPECTAAYFCDSAGTVSKDVSCADGEYINSDWECVRAPTPGCDGSCTGRCPNPVDCAKFLICDGTTVSAEDACLPGEQFDSNSKTCITTGATCPFLDGCALDVGFGTTTTTTTASTTTTTGTTTTASTTTTTGTTTTTTTPGSIYTVPPDDSCNSSTVGSKYPLDNCSKDYCKCAEVATGQYYYINSTCIGDYYFDTDPTNPYCTYQEDIDTCQ